jgi:hypothetical protein
MSNQKRRAEYNPEADKRWVEKNREHRNYLSARGAARSFLKNKATKEDLDEMEMIIKERRASMK